MKIRILVICVALFAVSAMSFATPVNNGIVKWSQLPDLTNPTLFDVISTKDFSDGFPNVIAMDDFLCTQTSQLTDLHFWGSYLDTCAIDKFYIAIHANIPAEDNTTSIDGGTEFSRPGERLFTVKVPFALANQQLVGVDAFGETVYKYTINFADVLTPDKFFTQTEGNIYWLGIKADTYQNTINGWGWHMAGEFPPNFDTALQLPGYDQETGCYNPETASLILCTADQPRDLAFELTFVPEPSTIAMILFGGLGVVGGVIRKIRR